MYFIQELRDKHWIWNKHYWRVNMCFDTLQLQVKVTLLTIYLNFSKNQYMACVPHTHTRAHAHTHKTDNNWGKWSSVTLLTPICTRYKKICKKCYVRVCLCACLSVSMGQGGRGLWVHHFNVEQMSGSIMSRGASVRNRMGCLMLQAEVELDPFVLR